MRSAFTGLYGFPMSPSRMSMLQLDPESGAIRERAELYEPERFFAQQLSALDWSVEGYVVVPVMADAGFRVEVFDAAAVGAGPVVVAAGAGHVVPFVIHSAWMPSAQPALALERTTFASELDRLARAARGAGGGGASGAELAEGVPMASAGP